MLSLGGRQHSTRPKQWQGQWGAVEDFKQGQKILLDCCVGNGEVVCPRVADKEVLVHRICLAHSWLHIEQVEDRLLRGPRFY